ncbi:MAG: glutamate formimidoyltransferase [Deltaproteobacteria bacterium]|nr:glutamate formimidoyltransferase [Deltaproteobacteria bacterium]
MKIMECVPNFSEGRDKNKVAGIAETLCAATGIRLLDYSMDADHNRSVFTFIGTPEAVMQGMMAACGKAFELIDMKQHKGAHPRIGAADVIPFIPLGDAQMSDAVETAHTFGRKLSARYHIPVYFYGEAALKPERKTLSYLRRGGYEGLRDKMQEPQWIPDAGAADFNENSGASCVGARMPLIAFNINLKTDDLAVAKTIAISVRESGGGLKCVQAMGVPLRSRNIVQVSMNLTDYRQTSIRRVFDAVKERTEAAGVDILESELIGLAPREAFADATSEYLQLTDFPEQKILETHLAD